MRKKSIFLKLAIAVGIAVAAVYASASTYIWARQSHFIFWPERILANSPADYLLPFEDLYISVVDDGDHK